MVLKLNSFRKDRYFRSGFREGRFLLATEASELQMEIFQFAQDVLSASFGNEFALEDSWKPSISGAALTLNLSEKQDGATISDKPSQAFFNGIPFVIDSPSSGILVGGSLPTGTTLSPNNVLNLTGSTPSDAYAIVVSAEEQRVIGSSTGDTTSTPSAIKEPFLRNQNVGVDTGEKRRLIYRIHMVPNSETLPLQTYPLASGVQNLQNNITLAGGFNYSAVSIGDLSGVNSEDKFVDFTPIGPNKIPSGLGSEEYIFGAFIDNNGNRFTIVNILNSPSGGGVLRYELDSERNQSDGAVITPVVAGGSGEVRLEKQPIFMTDQTQVPSGKVFWKLATAVWNGTVLSSLVDLRNEISTRSWNFDRNMELTDGGTVTWDSGGTDDLVFGDILRIRNPIGTADFTVAASSINLPSSGDMAFVALDETVIGTTLTRPDGGLLTLQSASVNTLSSGENIFVIAWRGNDNRLYLRGHGSMAPNSAHLLGQTGDPVSTSSATFAATANSDNLDFHGVLAPGDLAGITTEGSHVHIDNDSGAADIRIGMPFIVVADGQGTSHPAKEWNHRGDFEGNTEVSIQDALDFISDASIGTGAVIYLKPGIYTISTTISSTIDNVSFIGVKGQTVLQQSGDITIFNTTHNNYVFKNITFSGDSSVTSATTYLNVSGNDLFVNNCSFDVTSTTGSQDAINLSGQNILLTDNILTLSTGAGDAIVTNPLSTGNYKILHNNILGFDNAIVIVDLVENIIIQENIIKDGRSCISIDCVVVGETGESIIITHNSLESAIGSNRPIDISFSGASGTTRVINTLISENNIQQLGGDYAIHYRLMSNTTNSVVIDNVKICHNNIVAEAGIFVTSTSTTSGTVTINNFSISHNNIDTDSSTRDIIFIEWDSIANTIINNFNITSNLIINDDNSDGIKWKETANASLADLTVDILNISQNIINLGTNTGNPIVWESLRILNLGIYKTIKINDNISTGINGVIFDGSISLTSISRLTFNGNSILGSVNNESIKILDSGILQIVVDGNTLETIFITDNVNSTISITSNSISSFEEVRSIFVKPGKALTISDNSIQISQINQNTIGIEILDNSNNPGVSIVSNSIFISSTDTGTAITTAIDSTTNSSVIGNTIIIESEASKTKMTGILADVDSTISGNMITVSKFIVSGGGSLEVIGIEGVDETTSISNNCIILDPGAEDASDDFVGIQMVNSLVDNISITGNTINIASDSGTASFMVGVEANSGMTDAAITGNSIRFAVKKAAATGTQAGFKIEGGGSSTGVAIGNTSRRAGDGDDFDGLNTTDAAGLNPTFPT